MSNGLYVLGDIGPRTYVYLSDGKWKRLYSSSFGCNKGGRGIYEINSNTKEITLYCKILFIRYKKETHSIILKDDHYTIKDYKYSENDEWFKENW